MRSPVHLNVATGIATAQADTEEADRDASPVMNRGLRRALSPRVRTRICLESVRDLSTEAYERGFVDAMLVVAVAFRVRVVTDTLMPMACKLERVHFSA